jgi:hypothetical protein
MPMVKVLKGGTTMTQWLYDVEIINTEYEIKEEGELDSSPKGLPIIHRFLNDRGEEGWELVAFAPATPDQYYKGQPTNPFLFYAIFKRPV